MAEADTIVEQQMKWTQLGNSWVWPHKNNVCQRHYRTCVLVYKLVPISAVAICIGSIARSFVIALWNSTRMKLPAFYFIVLW